MSDRIRSTPDVPWKPRGVGHALTFRCDKCGQSHGTDGRKKVRGLFWWCKQCVEAGSQ